MRGACCSRLLSEQTLFLLSLSHTDQPLRDTLGDREQQHILCPKPWQQMQAGNLVGPGPPLSLLSTQTVTSKCLLAQEHEPALASDPVSPRALGAWGPPNTWPSPSGQREESDGAAGGCWAGGHSGRSGPAPVHGGAHGLGEGAERCSCKLEPAASPRPCHHLRAQRSVQRSGTRRRLSTRYIPHTGRETAAVRPQL